MMRVEPDGEKDRVRDDEVFRPFSNAEPDNGNGNQRDRRIGLRSVMNGLEAFGRCGRARSAGLPPPQRCAYEEPIAARLTDTAISDQSMPLSVISNAAWYTAKGAGKMVSGKKPEPATNVQMRRAMAKDASGVHTLQETSAQGLPLTPVLLAPSLNVKSYWAFLCLSLWKRGNGSVSAAALRRSARAKKSLWSGSDGRETRCCARRNVGADFLRIRREEGMTYSHTVSPFGVTSNKRPKADSQMKVLPFSSRSAPPI